MAAGMRGHRELRAPSALVTSTSGGALRSLVSPVLALAIKGLRRFGERVRIVHPTIMSSYALAVTYITLVT